MFKRLFNKRAQSTAEYAIVIAIVIGAAIAMQTYVKRGIQGRVAGAADNYTSKINSEWATSLADVGSTAATLSPQWEPDYLYSQSTRKVIGDTVDADTGEVTAGGTKTTETLDKGGTLTRSITEKTQQAAGDYRKIDY